MAGLVVEVAFAVALAVITFVVARRSFAAALVIALTALTFALSSVPWVKDLFLAARWGPLGALAAHGVLERWSSSWRPSVVEAFMVAVGVVAGASVLWSVEPQLTALRAISFAALLCVAFLLAGPRLARAGDPAAVDLVALLAPVVVGLSLMLWAVVPERAIMSNELRGFIENANGLGLLVALTYPFVLAAVERRSDSPWWPLAMMVVAASVIALSASRSGMLAIVVGVSAYELARRHWRRMAAELAVCAGVILGLALWAPVLWVPPEAKPATDQPAASDAAAGPMPTGRAEGGPAAVSRRQAATVSGYRPPPRTSLIGTGGSPGQSWFGAFTGARSEGWDAAVDIVSDRPLLGYGFGTGDRLFDRFRLTFLYYQGANPGNGYLQLLMEVGALGATVVLAPLVLATVAAVRLVVSGERDNTPCTVAVAALLLAGVAAATVESLFTAAGAPWAMLIWVSAAAVLHARYGARHLGRRTAGHAHKPPLGDHLAAGIGSSAVSSVRR